LYSVVDLFSGAGGMSFGFKANERFQLHFAVDAQKGKPSSGTGKLECNSSYETNIGIQVREADLSVYEPERLSEEAGIAPGTLDVLISCAPCTGFSRTMRENHLRDDPRNHLVERTGFFVEHLRPRVLVMENARELLMGNFKYHADALIGHLQKIGYSISAEVHMLTQFGLPQIRERALIVAVRDNAKVRSLGDLWKGFAVAPEALTVRRTIGKLPHVRAGEAHPNDAMHVSPGFAHSTSLDRIRAIPHDGGSWADLVRMRHPELDRLLIPSMKRTAERGDWGSHPDVYGRLWWERPCVTIKRECAHIGNGRYAHPVQDRLCTVREMGLMSGFPSSYIFKGSLSNKYRHIGDAVPPLISYQLSKVCEWILSERKPSLEDCVLPGTSLRSTDIIEVRGPLDLFDGAERFVTPTTRGRSQGPAAGRLGSPERQNARG
jgi:DNA (cytosine-5)-methyltransferase 1